MSVGSWLVILAILVYLACQPISVRRIGRGVLVGFAVVASLVILAGCEKPIELECNVGRVTGTFRTTQKELDNPRSNHVKMWRGDRMFYWPKDQVTACQSR